MSTSTPRVAEGASRFREMRAVERLAHQVGRLPISGGVRRGLKRIYQLALGAQTRGRGLACTLPGGEVVRVLPEFTHVSWNPDEYGAFRDAVRVGATALDIGANVGAYSLLLGLWAGQDGRVFAFEPAADAFDGLTRHIRLNRLEAVVRPVAAAVGDRETTARLLLAGTAGESRLAVDADTQPSTSVAMTSIDAFCAQHQLAPDFIKIDVEGWELAVLRGARQTIKARGRALALFVEMHPSIWPSLGISRDDVLKELWIQQLEPEPIAPAADIWSLEGVCLRLVSR